MFYLLAVADHPVSILSLSLSLELFTSLDFSVPTSAPTPITRTVHSYFYVSEDALLKMPQKQGLFPNHSSDIAQAAGRVRLLQEPRELAGGGSSHGSAMLLRLDAGELGGVEGVASLWRRALPVTWPSTSGGSCLTRTEQSSRRPSRWRW